MHAATAWTCRFRCTFNSTQVSDGGPATAPTGPEAFGWQEAGIVQMGLRLLQGSWSSGKPHSKAVCQGASHLFHNTGACMGLGLICLSICYYKLRGAGVWYTIQLTWYVSGIPRPYHSTYGKPDRFLGIPTASCLNQGLLLVYFPTLGQFQECRLICMTMLSAHM